MSVTTLRSEQELRELVERDAAHLETLSAHDVVAWAAGEFGESWAVAGSMQDGVLGHLVDQVAPGTRLYFLDTGYHFPETLATRDETVRRTRLDVITLTPAQTVPEQDAEHGVALHDRDPDLCCALRKVTPLADTLAEYDAWATGLRRAETHNRVIAPVVGWDARKQKVKVSPMARWTDEQVEQYVLDHGVLVNPLALDGYPSIGCAPCTRRVAPGEDPRSGRWAGTSKTECGLHV